MKDVQAKHNYCRYEKIWLVWANYTKAIAMVGNMNYETKSDSIIGIFKHGTSEMKKTVVVKDLLPE